MTEFPIPEGDLTAAESEELLLMCGHAPGPEPLSPAAQAVLTAIIEISPAPADEIAAAALRAAAQHLYHDWSAFNCIDALCEIAAELEANS